MTRLNAQFAASSLNIEAVPTPDSEEEYQRSVVKPRVTVLFAEASGGPLKSLNDRSTNETITIICEIQSRSLRGNADYIGCHAIARVLKELLVGYRPQHCGRLQFKGYKGAVPIRNEELKLWYWQVEFSCSKLFVQVFDESDPAAPLLQEVILIDQIETP